MDCDPGADTDLGHGAGLEACGGAPERPWEETEGEREGAASLKVKGGNGEFSSASSNSSLPSSSNLPTLFSSPPPICVEDESEMLTGCSKSFTGLKLFTRR
ncbi:hypothetical protein VZT92_017629 [Zoarces viviparus]|uniref:Uncharacterized protein n=1 Tax=Zoarces viviparus TaxID=48416 RepID=A0AAW1EMV9_ZOAVI